MSSIQPLALVDLSVGHSKALSSGINLEIKPGEFVTLMGENGSGKTTLVDSLLGLRSPLSGRILFWGEENNFAARKRINEKVGWVLSQKEHYPQFMDVRNLLAQVSQFYPTWNQKLCDQLVREFDLDISKRLGHLSLGEHSKVRLIKALSFEPDLIVLDELTANLSPSSKESILSALLNLFSSKSMSVFYVSHSNEESLKLSDRIFEMTTSGLRIVGGQNV